MTSQLDERPAQVLTPSPDRTESSSRSRTWIAAAAGFAVITLGAGLIVAVALADDARSPADKPGQVDASAFGINGGGLPAHLQEFEARMEPGSSDGGALPAHLQEFEARVEPGSSDGGALPAHLEEFEARSSGGGEP